MSSVSKAALIRAIVATGFKGKSPNTLRRWSVDELERLLVSLTPATMPDIALDTMMVAIVTPEPLPVVPIETPVVANETTPVYVWDDKPFYREALGYDGKPVELPVGPRVMDETGWLTLVLVVMAGLGMASFVLGAM